MAGAFGYADALPVLKEHYRGQQVADLTFKRRPAFGILPKRTGVGGKVYPLPIKIANIGGASNRFASAVANRSGSVYKEWMLTHTEDYATATLDHKTQRLLAGDRNGFIELVTSEMDSAFSTFANDYQFSLWSDGTGVRGVVTGAPAGAVITLADASQLRNFYVGMTLDIAATATGAVSGETPTVVAVGTPAVPTITVSAIGTIADTNFLFRAGDAPDNGANVKNEGFFSWMPDPTGITTGDDFYGVDRSVDKRRLLGLYYDASGQTVEQALVQFGAQLQANEAEVDVALMHPTTRAVLVQEIEQRGRYDKTASSDARVFYDNVTIETGGGSVEVVSDPWAPLGKAVLLQKNTWEIFSTDPLPTWISDDGARLHRLEEANEHEFRIGGYSNVGCVAPGKNGVITGLPSTFTA